MIYFQVLTVSIVETQLNTCGETRRLDWVLQNRLLVKSDELSLAVMIFENQNIELVVANKKL